jgi:hypothetical protein
MDHENIPVESGNASEPTPQQVLEYLDWLDDPATIEGLALRFSITRSHLQALLQRLEDRGEITADAGLQHVYVHQTTADGTGSAVADGSGRRPPTPDSARLEITLDELLDVLANDRRRAAIRVLDDWQPDVDERGFVTTPELAHGIDTGTLRTHDTRPGTEAVKSLYVALHETHVPRLDAAGLVDYRTLGRASTLEPLPLLGEVADVLAYLEAIMEAGEP